MRGIARTVWQLLYVSRLQRWLAAAGGVLLVIGLLTRSATEQPGTLLAAFPLLGVMLVVISPIVIDPILFRSVSAPRAIQLIPYGRLQLVLGAFCTQLLLAVCIGIAVGLATRFAAAVTCVICFGCLTVYFFGFFWAIQSRWAALVWVPFVLVPRLLRSALPGWHLQAQWLVDTSIGLTTIAATVLLLWLLFGVIYIRSRRLEPPGWQAVGPGLLSKPTMANRGRFADETPQFDRPQAIRVLLAGRIKQQQTQLRLAVGVVAFCLVLYTLNAKPSDANLFSPFIICLFAGIGPGLYTTMMRIRAKPLWLAAGMDRAELFDIIEALSWRKITLFSGVAMLLAIPMLAVSIHAHPAYVWSLGMLAIPVATGAVFVYANMLYVRGNRPTDMLLMGAVAVLFLTLMVSAATGSQILVPLGCGQIIAVPVLRAIAQRRWGQMDWLLNKAPVSFNRLT